VQEWISFNREAEMIGATPIREPTVQKSVLLRALQQEIRRHSFDTFVDEPPSVAQGGKGVVVPGCPSCKKRFETTNQFVMHLPDDVLPVIVNKLSAEKS
jgi:hypothetical protein